MKPEYSNLENTATNLQALLLKYPQPTIQSYLKVLTSLALLANNPIKVNKAELIGEINILISCFNSYLKEQSETRTIAKIEFADVYWIFQLTLRLIELFQPIEGYAEIFKEMIDGIQNSGEAVRKFKELISLLQELQLRLSKANFEPSDAEIPLFKAMIEVGGMLGIEEIDSGS